MLQQNRTGTDQVFYDRQVEPVLVRPEFAVNDLDLVGRVLPEGFVSTKSICEILSEKPEASICLVRESSIGDILLMTPMFFRIKELFPLCRIVFASVEHYLRMFEYADFVEPESTKRALFNDYDFGYDFNLSLERAEGNGWGRDFHRSEIFAKLLGLELNDYKYSLPFTDKEIQVARELLHSRSYDDSRPFVVFQLRGAHPSRSLRFESVRNVVSRIAGQGVQVAIVDAHAVVGWEEPNVLNFCGATDILVLAAVVGLSDLVVSTDSGLTHIAGAVGKKNVAFFGCIPSENRVRYRGCKVVDLARARGCQPCWEGGNACGRRWSCLQEADIDFVYEEITGELSG